MIDLNLLKIKFLTPKDREEICDWKYPEEYSVYNMPSYNLAKERGLSLADENKIFNYRGYFFNEELIAYTSMFEKEKEVYIGIGLKPEYCNKGYGAKILHIACTIAKMNYIQPLCVEVRKWNKRAISCYKKEGFVIEGSTYSKEVLGGGTDNFYKMVKHR